MGEATAFEGSTDKRENTQKSGNKKGRGKRGARGKGPATGGTATKPLTDVANIPQISVNRSLAKVQ